MKLGVPSVVIAFLAIIVIGCTGGNEIAPATSTAAPAPGNGDPLAALYAAPADVAFLTVADVGPADLPLEAYAFIGYGYAAELVVPFVDTPAWDAPFKVLDLDLTAADAVAPPVDVDALFAAAVAASAAGGYAPGPETQQPLEDWPPAPLDAK